MSVAEDVYSAMEESARLLGADCSRDKIWPALSAYQDVLADSVVVFSAATGRHAGELDYSISVPAGNADPYAVALSNGFITETDHPVSALHSQIRDRCPIGLLAIDGEAADGFKKTYQFFPPGNLQRLSTLASVPAMPRAVAGNAGVFARYGLDRIQMTSIDYRHRTVNLYFGNLPSEALEPESIGSMLREMGMPEPGEAALRLARRSFAIYPTLSWDSQRIERVCFAVITTDPATIPEEAEPALAKFARNAPYVYAGDRILVYGLTLAPGDQYYKLGAYYQVTDYQRKLLKAFDALGA